MIKEIENIVKLKSLRIIPVGLKGDTVTVYAMRPNHIHGIIAIVGAPLVGARTTAVDSPKRADTRLLFYFFKKAVAGF